MRLNKIKLAGFKSFVDPTVIDFQHELTGIIGPNGCGKSNTIDAVRWVMGESSAKQLRGDSMDDVIFNGSSSRPAVSKASVELIFDNSDKTLGGQYANYTEIHIRREVSRESGSNYFLNGTRCRRRDIADIFLGTGLGPRSYAIIEQGMISRIIEAKPEELRVYLEEAAGISKYKERRRETENRIKHTRENLDRLNDLREEIEKQLDRLKRQANAAERYKVLKEEERQLKAELLALRWQEFNNKAQEKHKALQAKQTEVEALIADQRSVEAVIEKKRQDQIHANDQLSKVQGEYYKHGSEISKVEQSIQHHKDTILRQQQDLEQVNEAWESAKRHIEDDRAKLESLNRSMQDKEPGFDELQNTKEQSNKRLQEAETAMREWQESWESFNKKFADASQTAEVESARIKQLEEKIERIISRSERLKDEREKISTEALEKQLEEKLQAEASSLRDVEKLQETLAAINNDILLLREQFEQQSEDLDRIRNDIAAKRGKLTSLQALQQAALGKEDEKTIKWLERKGLMKNPRLAEEINVEAGWEQAVETVLGQTLESVCVEDVAAITELLGEFSEGAVMFVDNTAAGAAIATDYKNESLLTKVSFKGSAIKRVNDLIGSVYVADSMQEALQLRQQLGRDESVITKEGIWMGAGWLRVNYASEGSGGVLSREQEITDHEHQIKRLAAKQESVEAQINTLKQQIAGKEQAKDETQNKVQEAVNSHAEIKADSNSLKNQFDQNRQRREGLSNELGELDLQIQQDQQQLKDAKGNCEHATHIKAQMDDQRQQLTEQRDQLGTVLHETRHRAEADNEAVHQIMISLESMRTAKASTGENLSRMQQQIAHLQQRREELQKALDESGQPIQALETQLKELLEKRVKIDEQLGEARTQLEVVENQIRENESKRTGLEQKVQDLRSKLEQERLAAQEIRVRCQTIIEQLQETDHKAEQLLESIAEDASADKWAERLEALANRINRMGPINLAAIDEHKEQSERKEYLDAQYKDLTDALETLEDAIEKIDKETRARFKEIFDQVNSRMGEMFPRLFGGGQAHLEMTGNDLLNTGIAIMARPPGKRVSNIHLLSGGEKALTAVAMVFAIFELNPAPFCMLDEVDAPLDEANVGRFCELVKEMSERVQLILITHNKTTMEMVGQLMGVTMREAGVSRLVAVDVDDAVKLATA